MKFPGQQSAGPAAPSACVVAIKGGAAEAWVNPMSPRAPPGGPRPSGTPWPAGRRWSPGPRWFFMLGLAFTGLISLLVNILGPLGAHPVLAAVQPFALALVILYLLERGTAHGATNLDKLWLVVGLQVPGLIFLTILEAFTGFTRGSLPVAVAYFLFMTI